MAQPAFTHFIIFLTNIGRVAPKRLGPFLKTGEFADRHVFEGRAIPIEDFNSIVPKTIETYKKRYISLPVVELITIAPDPGETPESTETPVVNPATEETSVTEPVTTPGETPESTEGQPPTGAPTEESTPEPLAKKAAPKKKAAKKKAAPKKETVIETSRE